MKHLLVVIMALSLSACLSADLRQYGKIDTSERAITVPPGGDLAADLKRHPKSARMGPRRRSWARDVTEGKSGKSVSLKSYNTYHTRYRLLLRYARFDTCLGHMDGAYNYNLSVIDNKDGKELMVMGGSACGSQIKAKFEEFLSSSQ